MTWGMTLFLAVIEIKTPTKLSFTKTKPNTLLISVERALQIDVLQNCGDVLQSDIFQARGVLCAAKNDIKCLFISFI